MSAVAGGTAHFVATRLVPPLRISLGDTTSPSARVRVLSFVVIAPDAFLHQAKRSITPLMAAIIDGRRDMVPLLLKAGAAIDMTDTAGDSALMAAAQRGATDVVRLLLRHGASLSLRRTAHCRADQGAPSLDARSDDSRRDVRAAWAVGAKGVGAVLNTAVDCVGDRALELAVRAGHQGVAALLREAHAQLDSFLGPKPRIPLD